MARVTVEDCINKVPNRFELVMLAVQRAREISRGGKANVPRDGDKNPVIALREIAESDMEYEPLWEELRALFRPAGAVQEKSAAIARADEEFAALTKGGDAAAAKEGADGKADEKAPEYKPLTEEDILQALQRLEGASAD